VRQLGFLLVVFFIFTHMTCQKQESQVITKKVKSKYVDDRNVSIFIPGLKYGTGPWPVLYMHDGQNIFEPGSAFTSHEWQVDETLERLMANSFPPCIVVGINNTNWRFQEYLPQEPNCFKSGTKSVEYKNRRIALRSDAYLKFIVEELKPKIDRKLPTKADRANTFIAGSSMGGLISLYAINEYPEIFGGAACLSTHWPLAMDDSQETCADEMIKHLGNNLPNPETHRIYFDFGTQGLDASYEAWQLKMDVLMRRAKYEQEKNWVTKKFEGHDHSEEYWQKRFETPLRFLLEK